MQDNDRDFMHDDSSIHDEDDVIVSNDNLPILPVVILKKSVILPGVVGPVTIGREHSFNAVKIAEASEINNGKVLLITQIDHNEKIINYENVHHYGTISSIVKVINSVNETVKVVFKSDQRVLIHDIFENYGCFFSRYTFNNIKVYNDVEAQAMLRMIKEKFYQFLSLSNYSGDQDIDSSLENTDNPEHIANIISTYMVTSLKNRISVLQTQDIFTYLRDLYNTILLEIDVAVTKNKLQKIMSAGITGSNGKNVSLQQIKNIKDAFTKKSDSEKSEIDELEQKLSELNLPKEASDKIGAELKRLRSMPPFSSEASIVISYLNWIIDLPWHDEQQEMLTLQEARQIMDDSHYSMNDIKDRIIEYLAVKHRTSGQNSGTILCLHGPPGVGKTSLVESIAKAMNKPFWRVSLGGVKDEAEIRGHRRTYIGSMPGKIIQAIKSANSVSPVILLDEIDKVSDGGGFKGDPENALLEVLDDKQNSGFVDHYLGVPYDLSKVVFIATANNLYDLSSPMINRMEEIKISGYTDDEKLAIAKLHLVPKLLEKNALTKEEVQFTDQAILYIINHYTHESGVRKLEQEIAKILRKIVVKMANGKKENPSYKITKDKVNKYLGAEKDFYYSIDNVNLPGLVNGLAYTSIGGDVLPIEVVSFPGEGNVKVTGRLGDVMQESAQAAFSLIKAKTKDFGIDVKTIKKQDFHIHVPDGATPKDGPSAGITITTALISLILNVPTIHDIAMTGEINLRGQVLPIGGLREKLLAARRSSITKVIIPEKNRSSLDEIPKEILNSLEIFCVSNINEVIELSLQKHQNNNDKATKSRKTPAE